MLDRTGDGAAKSLFKQICTLYRRCMLKSSIGSNYSNFKVDKLLNLFKKVKRVAKNIKTCSGLCSKHCCESRTGSGGSVINAPGRE
jgi:hypothetical protein